MTRTTFLSLVWALAACSGNIADPLPDAVEPGRAAGSVEPDRSAARSGTVASAEPVRPPAPAAEPPVTDACETADLDPGPAPLRRLTQEQYANTLRDLLGDVPGLTGLLDSRSQASEFGLVQPDLSPVELEVHQRAAETAAAYVAATPAKLQALAPCSSGMDERECARSFIQVFGARAYRAPLTEAGDIERHLQLYDAGKSVSHAHGIELVLRGMLQAPRFLYRVELGSSRVQGPKAVRLSGPEIAARLSYVLWNTLPDSALDRAARSGSLDSTEGVRRVVAQMQSDARGRHALRRFLERWMHLEKLEGAIKDERFYPEWTRSPGLRSSLAQQAALTLDDVLEQKDGSLRALLTSSSVFVNADLAAFYGVSAGDTFERIEPAAGRVSGILSLPALMAVLAKPAESSPIYRGKFVREALLCQQLPAPPPNIPKPPDVQAGVSTRERLSQHEVDPACKGCHQLMDPIGFGLENYDAIGRFRSEDAGDVIDRQGELKSTRDADGTFHGARELGERLSASSEVRDCMIRQWFRYALARFERDVDACTLQELSREFERAGADLRVLPELLLTSDAFLTRRPLDFEETP